MSPFGLLRPMLGNAAHAPVTKVGVTGPMPPARPMPMDKVGVTGPMPPARPMPTDKVGVTGPMPPARPMPQQAKNVGLTTGMNRRERF